MYSNRAACHFCEGDHKRCVKDCDSALALLETALVAAERGLREGTAERAPMDAARRSKLRVLARRGSAHCLLQNHKLAAADYKAALVLDPDNLDLKADLVAVEKAVSRETQTDLKLVVRAVPRPATPCAGGAAMRIVLYFLGWGRTAMRVGCTFAFLQHCQPPEAGNQMLPAERRYPDVVSISF